MKHTETIVLVHGLWMTPRSWEGFERFYERRGYRVFAPAWPHMKGEVEEIRRDPSALKGLGIAEIARHYENFVRALPEPPILMGHCFGGLIVQLLLHRGLGAAGVALGSPAPKGVWKRPFSGIKAIHPELRKPWNHARLIELKRDEFLHGFANIMSTGDAYDAYDRYIVPGPARPIIEHAFANLDPWTPCAVDRTRAERAPLLLMSGAVDRQVSPAHVAANRKKYRNSQPVTEYQELPLRSHFMIAQPGWSEVADTALSWAESQLGFTTATRMRAYAV